MNDDFLNHFRKPPRADFEAALLKRISKPMTTQTKVPALRPVMMGASVLAVLTLAIFAILSARTLAQNLLQQIGGYQFAQGTTYDASKVPAAITIVRTDESVSIQFTGSNVGQFSSAGQAGDQAGFGVLVPSYLPDGFTGGSEFYVIAEGNGTVVLSGYHDASKSTLFLNQWKAGEGDLKEFTREQIVEVTVRGHAGVWLPSSGGDNALVWEENGITYSLISSSLPLEEMLAVAESLN